MPSQPRKIRPIRVIRKTLGLNQGEMGELLGIARPTIERLENGTLTMPVRIVEQYHRQTGCDIIDGEPAATIDGKPFTREAFLEHQDSVHQVAENQMEARIQALMGTVEALLRASHRRKMLIRVSEDLESILTNLFKKNGLEAHPLQETLAQDFDVAEEDAEERACALVAMPLGEGIRLRRHGSQRGS